MLRYSPESLTRCKMLGIRLEKKGFHMPLKAYMCVKEKGDDAFASRNGTLFSSSVACVELRLELI